MLILAAAVAVVGGLCLLDLLLTFGVIRRLREHTVLLTGAGGEAARPLLGLSAGEHPGAFSATTTDGVLVSGVAGLRAAAFLSSGCSVCPGRVPPFANYLRAHHVSRDAVLVVFMGFDGGSPPYLADLADVAQICFEEEDGEIAKAFKVYGFPAFVLLDASGALVGSGWDPERLPEPTSV